MISIPEPVVDAIREAASLSLACHVNPDGDALGSMLGLAIAADEAGKQVAASFAEPFLVPPSLTFLPTGRLIPPDRFPKAPELMVVLDAGSIERVGALGENAKAAQTCLVLDHHVTNGGFGDLAIIEPRAAATGEIVYAVLQTLGWPLTPDIAQCLLTALVTDTGRFQYTNTTPDTLDIAARLVEAGADPSEIGRHVYEEAPFGYLKASAIALDRARLDTDRSVVATSLTDGDLATAGVAWSETENLIDLLRLAVEADTAVLAKGHEDGSVKVSLRSRGATDVGALAADMGGGGHRLAAGFTIEGDIESVIARIIESVESYR